MASPCPVTGHPVERIELMEIYGINEVTNVSQGHTPPMVVYNHWTGLLDWNTGLDYWTDIFLVFTHVEVGLMHF